MVPKLYIYIIYQMVKYYGRARQRIGSVNTNQIGLNMSGCPSKVGRQGYLSRYIGRRAQCNQKFCGPVYYHGVIWNYNSNLGRCVAKAPRGQSFNSGVGTKVGNPRFACNKTCSTDNSGFPWWYNNLEVLAAVNLLKSYFGSLGLNFVLVGEKETLASDVVPALPAGETIDHYEKGRPLYDTLPSIYLKRATDLINSINLELAVILDSGTVPMRHIVGAVTPQVAATLEADATPYGVPISFSSDVEVTAYASSSFCVPKLDDKEGCKSQLRQASAIVYDDSNLNIGSAGWDIYQSESIGDNACILPLFDCAPSPDNSPYFGLKTNENTCLLWAFPSPTNENFDTVKFYKL